MTLQEIRVSGLLELYLIGALSETENRDVEETIIEFPQLQKDLAEISNTLESYASLYSVTPPQEIKNQLLEKVSTEGFFVNHKIKPSNRSSKNKSKVHRSESASPAIPIWPILTSIFLLSSIWFWYKSYTSKKVFDQKISTLDEDLSKTSTEGETLSARLNILNQLVSADNEIITMTSSAKYPDSKVYMHINDVSMTSFLQYSTLPPLESGNVYQLWSKGSDNSINSVETFGNEDENQLIEIAWKNVPQYLLTIESTTTNLQPSLDELIGTFDYQ